LAYKRLALLCDRFHGRENLYVYGGGTLQYRNCIFTGVHLLCGAVSNNFKVKKVMFTRNHKSVLSVRFLIAGSWLIHIFCPFFVFSFRNVGMGTSTASARVSAFASAYAPLLVSDRFVSSDNIPPEFTVLSSTSIIARLVRRQHTLSLDSTYATY